MGAGFVSGAIGAAYTLAWTLSFYPQFILNFKRKSVVGLSLDFVWLNPVGFAAYTASNSALFWSSVVRAEYRDRHGGHNPQVQWNDLAFAIHALVLSSFTLLQSFVYTREAGQRSSTYTRLFVPTACLVVLVAVALAAPIHTSPRIEWLDVVYLLSYIKLFISLVKYMPQAFLNYKRKSTVGWSIENILLDLTGGTLSLAQLVLDSWMASDWTAVTGNPGKLGLSLLSISFDILFVIQHYALYGGATLSVIEVTAGVEDDDEAERRPLLSA